MDVRLPDGTVIKNVPDGTSKADLVTKLKANGMNVPDSWAAPASAPKPQGSAFDGLMNMIKGGGEAAMHLGSSALATPVAGLAGLGQAANNALGVGDGTPASDVVANAQDALTYRPRSDAGKATVGLVSKPLGYVADKINDAGQAAATATGSPAYGAATSALATALPDILGAELPAVGKAKVAAKAADAAATAPRQAALQAAKDAGYPIPPSEITGTPVGDALTAFAGKDELNKHIALASQKVTNGLARDDLGVSPNEPFNHGALDKAQTSAEQGYQAVRNADQNIVLVRNSDGSIAKTPQGKPIARPAGPVKLDDTYAADIAKIDDGGANAAPGAQPNAEVAALKSRLEGATSAFSPDDAITSLNRTRKEAQANLKNTTDPNKLQLGQAQMQAADALEAQISRYLQNQPDLYKNFTASRTQLAKIRTVRDAMDTSGDVDAAAINAERYKTGGSKSPMSGGLLKIANAADTLPNTVKNTSKVQAPAPVSKLGMYFALAGGPGAGALGGHMAAGAGAGAGAAALLAGPWAARKFLGSDAYQGTLGGRTPTPSVLDRLAANPASPFTGLLATPDQPQQ